MIDYLLTLQTNEALFKFVLNNLILLMLIRYCLDYIVKKTPWAIDDDLPSFFGGAIDLIKNRSGKENETDKIP